MSLKDKSLETEEGTQEYGIFNPCVTNAMYFSYEARFCARQPPSQTWIRARADATPSPTLTLSLLQLLCGRFNAGFACVISYIPFPSSC